MGAMMSLMKAPPRFSQCPKQGAPSPASGVKSRAVAGSIGTHILPVLGCTLRETGTRGDQHGPRAMDRASPSTDALGKSKGSSQGTSVECCRGAHQKGALRRWFILRDTSMSSRG